MGPSSISRTLKHTKCSTLSSRRRLRIVWLFQEPSMQLSTPRARIQLTDVLESCSTVVLPGSQSANSLVLTMKSQLETSHAALVWSTDVNAWSLPTTSTTRVAHTTLSPSRSTSELKKLLCRTTCLASTWSTLPELSYQS